MWGYNAQYTLRGTAIGRIGLIKIVLPVDINTLSPQKNDLNMKLTIVVYDKKVLNHAIVHCYL